MVCLGCGWLRSNCCICPCSATPLPLIFPSNIATFLSSLLVMALLLPPYQGYFCAGSKAQIPARGHSRRHRSHSSEEEEMSTRMKRRKRRTSWTRKHVHPPQLPKKSRAASRAPLLDSSPTSVAVPRSFRERLMTSRLVNVPQPPPEFSLEYIRGKFPILKLICSGVPRLVAQPASCHTALRPPNSPPPSTILAAPRFPTLSSSKSRLSFRNRPVSEQRTRWRKFASSSARQTPYARSGSARCWPARTSRSGVGKTNRGLSGKGRRRRVATRGEGEEARGENAKRVDEPVRIRTWYGKIASLLEDYKAPVTEDISVATRFSADSRPRLSPGPGAPSAQPDLRCRVRGLPWRVPRPRDGRSSSGLACPRNGIREIPRLCDGGYSPGPASRYSFVEEALPRRVRGSRPAGFPPPSGSSANKSFVHGTFAAYLERHKGIKTMLKTLVGSSRIIRGKGCERCDRNGPCFVLASPAAGAKNDTCLPCVTAKKKCEKHGLFHIPFADDFISFWNDNLANSPVNDLPDEPSPKRRKEKIEPSRDEKGVDRKGKGKARDVGPSTEGESTPKRSASVHPSALVVPPCSTIPDAVADASSAVIGWEPALTYTLADLTPLPLSRLDRIPLSSRRGCTMCFGFPPEDCSEEERARRYAACTSATVQYFSYLLRCNAQLAGHEFILRLVENLHPLRYRLPPVIGPTPSLHSEPYPVTVPELRGNLQWRALLRAYMDEVPLLMHHAHSELGQEDLDLLQRGEFHEPDFSGLEGFRAVDVYRWITRDSISLADVKSFEGKPLFLPVNESDF
ncbi:hypothetical protein B0H13DRAFT_1919514 [Mycena leptocephala]|nr:hypothetical protein B0H13DRAFT_1919514 [Mycena leptocephala]